MLRSTKKAVKEVKLKLIDIKNEIKKIVQDEQIIIGNIADSAWESYKVRESYAPLSDVEEAILSIEAAIQSLTDSLEEG